MIFNVVVGHGSVLCSSLVTTSVVLKDRCASDNVFVTFPFAIGLVLAISVVVIVGKSKNREKC